MKEWVKKPGIRAKYLKQYLGRYLFVKQYKDTAVHQFFIEAAQLYPSHADSPQETRTSAPVPVVDDDPLDDPDDPEFDFDL